MRRTIIALAVCWCASPALAQKIFVDLDNGGGPPAPGYAGALEGGGGANVWNALAAADGALPVNAETGAGGEPVVLDGDGIPGSFAEPGPAGDDAALMNDFVFDPGHTPADSGVDFVFSGLDVGGYTVIVYTWGPTAATGGIGYETNVTGSTGQASTKTSEPTGAWPGGFSEGITHTVHNGVFVAFDGGTIIVNVRVSEGAGAIVVNGMQLAPENSSATYQGQISQNGMPFTGSPDIRFRIFDRATGGSPLGTFPANLNPVLVSGGLFSTPFSFSPAAYGTGRRWLSVTVDNQELGPRQEIGRAPFAHFANRVPWSGVMGRPARMPPAGRAGGDLAGSYPSPVIAANAVTTPKLATAAVTPQKINAANASPGNALMWNGASVVWGTPVGTLALPFSGSVSSGIAFTINNTGTSDVASLNISNAASAAECVDAQSNGSGNVVEATMLGTGRAGDFVISNTANANDCLLATGNGSGNSITAIANGTGNAGSFSNALVTNPAPAVEITSAGSPGADTGTLNCVNTNTSAGRTGYFENRNSAHYTIRVNNTTGALAGQFVGNVAVFGDLSATGTKPFCIDHPLDPANKYLYHYALESPEVLNVYRGTVVLDGKGTALVELPAYFEALNREFDYQLTPIGAAMPDLHVADEISGNRFRIAGGKPGRRVSWQVTAARNDAYVKHHGAPVEVEKEPRNRGYFLQPELFGQPADRRVSDGSRD